MSIPHLKVNGVAIKNPSTMKVSSYNLTKSGRVASGKMTMEIVARKWKVENSYEVISGADMDKILSLIDNGKPFFTVEFLHNGAYRTAKCYVGDIIRERFRTSMGWYWKNVQFNFIEQ